MNLPSDIIDSVTSLIVNYLCSMINICIVLSGFTLVLPILIRTTHFNHLVQGNSNALLFLHNHLGTLKLSYSENVEHLKY